MEMRWENNVCVYFEIIYEWVEEEGEEYSKFKLLIHTFESKRLEK